MGPLHGELAIHAMEPLRRGVARMRNSVLQHLATVLRSSTGWQCHWTPMMEACRR